MKVAIYVRLSKEDDDVRKQISGKQESESIQNQKSLLIQYAVERGYDIYNIYTDEDYSGADRDRPAFSRLIQDASQHKFDIVLAKSQSRFTRDMELVERYLHGKFPEWGIRFIALVDHADTNDASNKKARQINGLINEWYLEDLSINVRTVLTHKCQSGQHIGSFAPYGYAKDPADHNHLVIDPVAAAVVRRIFSMVLSGYGASRIAKTLNEEGIPNPTRYKQQQGLNFAPCQKSRVPGLWSTASVRTILTNQTYTGDLVQGRHKKASYKSKKIVTLPKDKWSRCSSCGARGPFPACTAASSARLPKRFSAASAVDRCSCAAMESNIDTCAAESTPINPVFAQTAPSPLMRWTPSSYSGSGSG